MLAKVKLASMDVLPMEVPDLSWMVLLEDVPGCTGGLWGVEL